MNILKKIHPGVYEWTFIFGLIFITQYLGFGRFETGSCKETLLYMCLYPYLGSLFRKYVINNEREKTIYLSDSELQDLYEVTPPTNFVSEGIKAAAMIAVSITAYMILKYVM